MYYACDILPTNKHMHNNFLIKNSFFLSTKDARNLLFPVESFTTNMGIIKYYLWPNFTALKFLLKIKLQYLQQGLKMHIYIYIYIYIYIVECLPVVYLIPPCLTLSNVRYVSRVKWSNPGKGVVPSPTPRCSSYWKESLLVALDYARQLYFTYIYIYIYIYIRDVLVFGLLNI